MKKSIAIMLFGLVLSGCSQSDEPTLEDQKKKVISNIEDKAQVIQDKSDPSSTSAETETKTKTKEIIDNVKEDANELLDKGVKSETGEKVMDKAKEIQESAESKAADLMGK